MRLIFLILFSSLLLVTHAETVKIGVLAKRGVDVTHKRWDATAQYLTEKISDYQFEIVALGFDELQHSVAEGEIDFVLTNTVYYVELEYLFGISRIATLINKNRGSLELTRFGGVLFTRADNHSIQNIHDIEEKKLGAVDPHSFGGWIMAKYELFSQGITEEDIHLSFHDSHDAVVHAVLDGKIDAGTVRSDTLERMVEEETITLDQIHIIDQKNFSDFPYISSTSLYPEWPFAKLSHTSRELANRVLTTLLSLPKESKAADSAHIAGWTIPLDYTSVHSVLRKLELPPYDKEVEISFAQYYKTHQLQVNLLLLLITAGAVTLFYMLRLNKTLEYQQSTITSLNKNLEQKVLERTQKIEELLLEEKEHSELVNAILNSQENLLLLSDGISLLRANQAVFDVTGYKSLEALKAEHQCICELFIKEEGYIYAYEDKNWLQYIMEHPKLEHKAKMIDQRDVQECVYLIKSAKFSIHQHDLFITTLTDITELECAYEEISEQALKDELTGIYNRRKFNEVLDLEFNRAQHNKGILSVIMFDIDDFKQINDTYGHDTGDHVLRTISAIVTENTRQSDTFARWGGEEFMILAPSMKIDNAHQTADKLRRLIEKHLFEEIGQVTCSFGVGEYKPGEKKEALLKEVDSKLYRAKEYGKNQVISD